MFVSNFNADWTNEDGVNSMTVSNKSRNVCVASDDDMCVEESASTSFQPATHPCSSLTLQQSSSADDISFLEISNCHNNFRVSFQQTPSMNNREVCETWPIPMNSISVDSLTNGGISINVQSQIQGGRRGWREHMRRMSTTFHKSTALRLRGVVKGPSLCANKNRSNNGIDEAMIFSLSAPHSTSSSAGVGRGSVSAYPSSIHKPTRAPRWMSIARRALDRVVRTNGHRKPSSGLGFSYRNISCRDVLDTIEEFDKEEVEEREHQVSSAMDQLNRLSVAQTMGTFRVKGKQRPERRVRKQLSVTNFELGSPASTTASRISTHAHPANSSHRIQANIEDELCERLSDLPLAEADPDVIRDLRNSMQSLQFTHFKQE